MHAMIELTTNRNVFRLLGSVAVWISKLLLVPIGRLTQAMDIYSLLLLFDIVEQKKTTPSAEWMSGLAKIAHRGAAKACGGGIWVLPPTYLYHSLPIYLCRSLMKQLGGYFQDLKRQWLKNVTIPRERHIAHVLQALTPPDSTITNARMISIAMEMFALHGKLKLLFWISVTLSLGSRPTLG